MSRDSLYNLLVDKPLSWFLSRFSGQVGKEQRSQILLEVKSLVFAYLGES